MYNNANNPPNEIMGTSSIYLLDVKKGAMAYRYDVEVEFVLPNGHKRSLTRAKDE